ncbi:MAG TPA: type II toxin-antitoxin system RelE/ParE family toxin [Beijerinckiaceae bacterium]|jgi:proteic killer suppression protein
MIVSIRHKGLRRLYRDADGRGLNAEHLEKIELILAALDSVEGVEALDLPSFRLHPLVGDRRGWWSITVRANWRIIFRFDEQGVHDVDLVDYH